VEEAAEFIFIKLTIEKKKRGEYTLWYTEKNTEKNSLE
jgi:hypothetical protein